MSQWKARHEEAHKRYRDGKKPILPTNLQTLRRENEFELAVEQRGKRAKQAAIKRGEISREAA